MAEEMQSTPKAAFVNKPYTQEERVKRDEEELEELMKAREGEEEVEEVVEVLAPIPLKVSPQNWPFSLVSAK